jgi:nucleotide-binding universal stress UspA family protein
MVSTQLLHRPAMFKHILLATDGSPASEHAAQLAVDLARVHGARLTALYVVDPYPYLGIGESNPLGFQAYMSAALEHGAQAHNKVAALCEKAPVVPFQARLAEDVAAAPGIVQSARQAEADLIVVGSHGRGGVARLMLGSVATKVVAESAIPVLVAR